MNWVNKQRKSSGNRNRIIVLEHHKGPLASLGTTTNHPAGAALLATDGYG